MKKYIPITIFVILFVAIISIIAILFARGYNFRESEENGILNITSDPSDGDIYINGQLKAATPEKIELAAGKYEIKIIKENYKEWKKEILVEPSLVTDISAKLFPQKLGIDQLTFLGIEKVIFSETKDLAVFSVTQKPNKGFWTLKLEKSIFDISEAKPQKVAELDAIPDGCLEKSYNMKISRDSTRLIIECKNKTSKDFYTFALSNSVATESIHINSKIGFNPDSVEFSFNSNNLVVSDDQIIANFSLENNKTTLLARTKDKYEPRVALFGRNLLILDEEFDSGQKQLFIIDQNLVKTEIEIPETIDPNSILDISAASQDTPFWAFSTKEVSSVAKGNNLENVNDFIKKDVIYDRWSLDAFSFLFQDADKLKTATIRTLPNNDFRVSVNTVIDAFDYDRYKVKWGPNSKQLIYYDSEAKKTFAIDKDGTNKTLIYDKGLANPDSFTFSKNETFVVLLLKDDKNLSNLYSIRLKI